MEDRKLYHICLVFSIVSIVALLIFSYLTEPERVSISSIDEEDIGEEVEISGVIKDRYLSQDGHLFFHVKDKTGEIDSVIFKDMEPEPQKMREGRRVKIVGEIGIHKGNLQIVPEKVML